MKIDGIGVLLWKYIRQYRLTAAMFVMFGAIFLSIFSLYRLETEAVAYAVFLCLLCTVIILSVHFFFYCKKHDQFLTVLKNISLLQDQLPKPSNLMEADLYRMIEALQKINQTNRNEWNAKRSDSVDYYTTWVHQIKAPIAVMRLILQSRDTEEHQELLAELFRIEQYTEMALCYIRLDSSDSDLVLERLELDPVLRQAIRKFAPQFVRQKIRLRYEGTAVKVLTDQKWLFFILEQLLSNALKYTKEGSVTISVDENQVVRISDTGMGIAPEDLPRIFEKGFTGYNGRADKKATGLGLYLCKKAADQLSHSLSVSSRVGQGTTVAIDLHSGELEVE